MQNLNLGAYSLRGKKGRCRRASRILKQAPLSPLRKVSDLGPKIENDVDDVDDVGGDCCIAKQQS